MSDAKVDAYIEKAQPFAQPILRHLRELASKAEPEAAEALRWGAPFWILKGRQLCGMASFKKHCAFILEWDGADTKAMGNFGRITSIEDLPSDEEIIALIQQKAARIRSGEDAASAKRKAAKPKPKIAVPEDFSEALSRQKGACAVWEGFTDAQRRDYLEWITSAKREATRAKRISTACEWIGQGKKRNWKYENC